MAFASTPKSPTSASTDWIFRNAGGGEIVLWNLMIEGYSRATATLKHEDVRFR